MMPEWKPDVSLTDLTSALGLLIGHDGHCNNEMEKFIARLDPSKSEESIRNLQLHLAGCRERTTLLALLYSIVRSMDEATLRALYARSRNDLQRGKAA